MTSHTDRKVDKVPSPVTPKEAADEASKHIGLRQAEDGHWYLPDPNRPGKYLRIMT